MNLLILLERGKWIFHTSSVRYTTINRSTAPQSVCIEFIGIKAGADWSEWVIFAAFDWHLCVARIPHTLSTFHRIRQSISFISNYSCSAFIRPTVVIFRCLWFRGSSQKMVVFIHIKLRFYSNKCWYFLSFSLGGRRWTSVWAMNYDWSASVSD